MKAGVYLDPIGNLIYVAKDRTIKAMSCGDFGARKVGAKVSHRAKDDTVQIEGTDYRCTRHADVPNGCTDHKSLVDSMQMAAGLKPGERVVDYGTKFARIEEIDGITEDGNAIDLKTTADDPYKRTAAHMRGAVPAGPSERRYFTVPPELTMPYTERELEAWREKFADTLREQGFRIVHKVSARKHKKQGHTVIPLHDGGYAWRPAGYVAPYQRETLRSFGGQPNVAVKVPAGIGKSEAGAL